MNPPLDEFERRILLAVQDDGRLSVNDLAERIGLSSSPTWRRLRALEERGVIRRYVAHVKVVSGVKRKTISALVYPAILLVLSCIVVAIIVLRVVPEFAAFYEGAAAQLPLSTRVLVSVSNFAGAYFGLMVLTVLALVLLFWTWLKRPANRLRFDRWVLSIPLLGSIAQPGEQPVGRRGVAERPMGPDVLDPECGAEERQAV